MINYSQKSNHRVGHIRTSNIYIYHSHISCISGLGGRIYYIYYHSIYPYITLSMYYNNYILIHVYTPYIYIHPNHT